MTEETPFGPFQTKEEKLSAMKYVKDVQESFRERKDPLDGAHPKPSSLAMPLRDMRATEAGMQFRSWVAYTISNVDHPPRSATPSIQVCALFRHKAEAEAYQSDWYASGGGFAMYIARAAEWLPVFLDHSAHTSDGLEAALLKRTAILEAYRAYQQQKADHINARVRSMREDKAPPAPMTSTMEKHNILTSRAPEEVRRTDGTPPVLPEKLKQYGVVYVNLLKDSVTADPARSTPLVRVLPYVYDSIELGLQDGPRVNSVVQDVHNVMVRLGDWVSADTVDTSETKVTFSDPAQEELVQKVDKSVEDSERYLRECKTKGVKPFILRADESDPFAVPEGVAANAMRGWVGPAGRSDPGLDVHDALTQKRSLSFDV